MRRFYPQLLVALQFGIIGLMVVYTLLDFHFSITGMGILLVGIAVGIWALNHNRLGNFNIIPELREGCTLVTGGIYRYIRHPMYTAVILMMLGVLLFHPDVISFVLWLILIAVLYLKAHREESLWMQHDPCYEAYRQQTRCFIPYIL
jgi:protein-S-isoprenylcysteine O-methyltransferase Ste14